MGIDEILGQARNLWDAMTQKRVTDYRGLVQAIHGGKRVKPDQIVEILDAVRKTPEDLKADLALAKQRDEWRKMIDEEPALSARQVEINRLKDEIEKELNRRIRELEAEARAKLGPLDAELQSIFVKFAQRVHIKPRVKLLETSSRFDEVQAVANAFPTEGIPVPGTFAPGNIHSRQRDRDLAIREVRQIERQIDEAKERRNNSLAGLGGLASAQDKELASLGKQLKIAKESVKTAEDDIAKIKSKVAAHERKQREIEALAVAE